MESINKKKSLFLCWESERFLVPFGSAVIRSPAGAGWAALWAWGFHGAARTAGGVLRVQGVFASGFGFTRLRRGRVGRHCWLWSFTELARSCTEPFGQREVRSGCKGSLRRVLVSRGSGGGGLGDIVGFGVSRSWRGVARSLLDSGRCAQGVRGLCVGCWFHAAPAGAGWATLLALEFHGVGAELHGGSWTAGGVLRAHEVFASGFGFMRFRRGRVGRHFWLWSFTELARSFTESFG